MKNILAFVALSILSLSVKAQELQSNDSVEYGRFFLGIDLVPLGSLLTGDKNPDTYMQLKWVSLKNPCNRYRITYQHINQNDQWKLKAIKPGQFDVVADSFQLKVNTTGTSRYFLVGFGYERAKKLEKFDFIYGADVVLGRRTEEIHDNVYSATFASDSAETEFYSLHSDYSYTTVYQQMYGVAPFVGIEKEFGERISIQASMRGIASYDRYSGRSSSVGWSDPHLNLKDRYSFRYTGVNVVMFLRF